MMSTKSPDLFSFTVTGLRDIMDKHGDQSTQAADASDLVNNFINKVLHNVMIKKNCFVCSHLQHQCSCIHLFPIFPHQIGSFIFDGVYKIFNLYSKSQSC